jgi:hypothetical protein
MGVFIMREVGDLDKEGGMKRIRDKNYTRVVLHEDLQQR